MKQHYHWLDLIRFLAAMCVVLVHARGEVWETYSLLDDGSKGIATQITYAALSLGYAGVIVFFVLSGFLVGGRTIDNILNSKANIHKYIIDRSVRIGLPLIGSIALIFVVNLWLGKPTNYITLLGNLFGLQGIFVDDAGGVFWTLSYEIWFYILIGGLILFCSKQKICGSIVITIAVCSFTALDTFLLFILVLGIMSYFLAQTNKQTSVINFNYSFLFIRDSISTCKRL